MTTSIGGTTGVTFPDASVQNTAATGFGFKNRIINGAMMIDQRNAGASVTNLATAAFSVDRWKTIGTQASKFTIQQNAGAITPPAGFSNYVGVTSLSAYSSLATDTFVLSQWIEGYNISDFALGTPNAQSFTISFLVRSSLTGTFGGAVNGYNGSAFRTYPFSFAINAANTWEYKTVTVVGDTTSFAYNTSNGYGLDVVFDLGSGSNYAATGGAWTAGNYSKPTGATSVVATSGATFYITGVQLEKGSTATSFDYRPYGTELALCQRYFEMVYKTWGTWPATDTFRINGRFAVKKRSQPTATQYASIVYAENYGVSTTSTSSPAFGTYFGGADFYDIPITGFSTAYATNTVGVAGNNSDTTTWANNFVGFSAEL